MTSEINVAGERPRRMEEISGRRKPEEGAATALHLPPTHPGPVHTEDPRAGCKVSKKYWTLWRCNL